MTKNNPMQEDPMLLQLTSILIGADAIELQEQRGQQALIYNDVLPRDMRDHNQADFEKLGFAFGEILDDLFISCTYPDGWTKERTDHAMWSHLLDANGSKRASIFYKAAFYDRDAHISLNNRYIPNYEPQGGWLQDETRGKPNIAFVEDRVRNIRIWESNPLSTQKRISQTVQLAKDWLNKNYPEWDDVHAYWNDNS